MRGRKCRAHATPAPSGPQFVSPGSTTFGRRPDMQHWMRKVAAGMFVLALVGCESAVLVNNRPDRDPAIDNTDNASQTAAARIDADTATADQAQPAATTQPADQRVNTSK